MERGKPAWPFLPRTSSTRARSDGLLFPGSLWSPVRSSGGGGKGCSLLLEDTPGWKPSGPRACSHS